ncbi:hypothetical protein [Pseudoalteromonas sp. R3]|uniref:hypothetical protein n=1 Tax=Pseudoalteromonas sp. R3 TaxID=1709477 RepID=UPI000FDE81B4|nr:hypothetical protein [Pseudoalteromonas sp. R3]AZZ97241.1 hypothetical protein ELR70_08850 [Pseudoalteromonas sp. R3]
MIRLLSNAMSALTGTGFTFKKINKGINSMDFFSRYITGDDLRKLRKNKGVTTQAMATQLGFVVRLMKTGSEM